MSDADPIDEHDGGGEGEECIVLRASGAKWVWSMIGSMVFVTLGAGMALGARTGVVAKGIGWAIVALFGFCAITALRQMLNPGSLIVRHTAIDMIRRGRLTTFAFEHCGRFSAWLNPSRGTRSVVFDYALDGDTELNRENRRLMGGSRAFADNYGMSAESLADLLNDVRNGASRT